MKNKILNSFRDSVPYFKELRVLTKSVTASILMQQMDYWFYRYPNGFYKFIEPPKKGHALYRDGDSWCEELGFSKYEFNNAFKEIGVKYKSISSFKKEADPFKGKYYCSVYDRLNSQTQYIRNHDKLDKDLMILVSEDGEFDDLNKDDSLNSKGLISRSKETEFPEVKKLHFPKARNFTSRSKETSLPESKKLDFVINTENTSENTSEKLNYIAKTGKSEKISIKDFKDRYEKFVKDHNEIGVIGGNKEWGKITKILRDDIIPKCMMVVMKKSAESNKQNLSKDLVWQHSYKCWDFMLTKWDMVDGRKYVLPPFHRNDFKIEKINKEFINILTLLKNGKATQYKKEKPTEFTTEEFNRAVKECAAGL